MMKRRNSRPLTPLDTSAWWVKMKRWAHTICTGPYVLAQMIVFQHPMFYSYFFGLTVLVQVYEGLYHDNTIYVQIHKYFLLFLKTDVSFDLLHV